MNDGGTTSPIIVRKKVTLLVNSTTSLNRPSGRPFMAACSIGEAARDRPASTTIGAFDVTVDVVTSPTSREDA
jgi:hypothetical protein